MLSDLLVTLIGLLQIVMIYYKKLFGPVVEMIEDSMPSLYSEILFKGCSVGTRGSQPANDSFRSCQNICCAPSFRFNWTKSVNSEFSGKDHVVSIISCSFFGLSFMLFINSDVWFLPQHFFRDILTLLVSQLRFKGQSWHWKPTYKYLF